MKTEVQMRSFSATTEQKDRNRCSKQNNSNNTSLQKVKKFRKEIKRAHIIYALGVIVAYTDDLLYFFYANVKCYNGCEYHTCDTHLKKKKIPCQAVCNKLQLFELPNEINDLRKLEKVIISKGILFKKIVIMPKGQAPKLNVAICNVQLEADDVCNILPRGADSNGIIMVKLKRKLM